MDNTYVEFREDRTVLLYIFLQASAGLSKPSNIVHIFLTSQAFRLCERLTKR